jgi:hypothetical protein
MSRLALLIVAIACLASTAFSQEGDAKPEVYSGVAVGTGGGMAAKSIHFDFEITRYATDQEVQQLALLLKEKGPNALLEKLREENVGRIRPATGTGNQIAVARKRKDGPNTVITVVTARNMSFGEVAYGGRSVDYPYGVLRVTLNEKGEGTGQILVAAKIRFDKKKGHYEIESAGNQYLKATNVRPE